MSSSPLGPPAYSFVTEIARPGQIEVTGYFFAALERLQPKTVRSLRKEVLPNVPVSLYRTGDPNDVPRNINDAVARCPLLVPRFWEDQREKLLDTLRPWMVRWHLESWTPWGRRSDCAPFFETCIACLLGFWASLADLDPKKQDDERTQSHPFPSWPEVRSPRHLVELAKRSKRKCIWSELLSATVCDPRSYWELPAVEARTFEHLHLDRALEWYAKKHPEPAAKLPPPNQLRMDPARWEKERERLQRAHALAAKLPASLQALRGLVKAQEDLDALPPNSLRMDPARWGKEFRRRQRAYARAMRQAVKAGVVRKEPKKKNVEHFDWTVRYQVLGESYAQIAEDQKDASEDKIRKAVPRTAKLLGLVLRKGKPGPPPKNKDTGKSPRVLVSPSTTLED